MLLILLFTAISAFQIPFLQTAINSIYNYQETPPVKLDFPRSSEVSERDVLLHLDKSLVVQCGPVRIANGDCMCDDRLKEVDIIQVNSSRAAVYWHDAAKELVVTFRQSTTVDDWIKDLASQQVPLPGFNETKVHEGFLTQLEMIDEYVVDEIHSRTAARDFQDYTLVITGYSLGGAMAMLFAAKNSKKFPNFKKIRTYAYASPRVGNKKFAQLLDYLPFPVIRYTIQNDFVSLLPPRALGYVHGGAEFMSIPTSTGTSLKQCSLLYDEDPSCVFNLTKPLEFTHFLPNNKPVPSPLFCPEA